MRPGPAAADARRGSAHCFPFRRLAARRSPARSLLCSPLTVPSPPAPSSADALTLPGITAPFPDMFDPAGFTRTAAPKDVKRWRESELMHGRIAMLAALGFVIGEQLEDFPAFMNFDGSITGALPAWAWRRAWVHV